MSLYNVWYEGIKLRSLFTKEECLELKKQYPNTLDYKRYSRPRQKTPSRKKHGPCISIPIGEYHARYA